MRPLIFERPELQAPQQRVVYGVLTLAFWVLWLYLWLPVVSLVAWLLGGLTFYHEMLERSGYQAVTELLAWYGAIVGALGGGLVLWASYNWFRFRSGDRRRPLPALTTRDMAIYFRVGEADLAQWQVSKRAVVHRDDHGEITAVEIDVPIVRPTLRPLETRGVPTAIARRAAPPPADDAGSSPRPHHAQVRADQRRS
jgi:biofilm PGA synthesis protein PgaD